jgi:hypothetical protein
MLRFEYLAQAIKGNALLAYILLNGGNAGGGGTVIPPTPPTTSEGLSPGWGFSDDAGYNPSMWPYSDPVTQAVNPTGGGRRFDVYNDSDLNAVPFATLGAGDVINIFYSATPYKKIWRVRGQGTSAAPIIVNGVTDSNGNRPIFSAENATVAAGCVTATSDSIFNGTNADAWQYREKLGMIGTANGLTDPYDQQYPRHIRIRNLEITKCKQGLFFTDAMGTVRQWGESSGIRLQNGQDVFVENCVIWDNDFGYFTQSRGPGLGEVVQRPVLRNCRLYLNGRVGYSTEHNIYMQAADPLIEGCYIGALRAGALGSSLKTRSSGGVIRYNDVRASQRVLDIVEAEEQWLGLHTLANYPIAHVYGNLLVNDFDTAYGGSVMPIHLGGDKNVSDGGLGSADVTDAILTSNIEGYGPFIPRYMNTMYFYNNTVVFRSDANQCWRTTLFDLSLSGNATGARNPRTTVHEFNNVIRFIGTTRRSLTFYSGQVNHLGGSIYYSDTPIYLQHENGDPTRSGTSGSRLEGAISLINDIWKPSNTSGLPSPVATPALPSSFMPAMVVQYEPKVGATSGMIRRTNLTAPGAFAI